MPSIAHLMEAAERGDRSAAEALFARLYADLHRLAQRELGRGGSATLGATTLLHEAYLEMSGRDKAEFPDRARFMAYAARVMRGLIVDYARRRQAQKRGGLFQLTTLGTEAGEYAADADELERLNDALESLADVDPVLAEVVNLRFFCGFSIPEIARMRGVSERTVHRQWQKARIFLSHTLGAIADPP